MRIELVQSDPPAVRVTLTDGRPPIVSPCVDLDQARAYDNGLLDGARYLASEQQAPTAWYYAKGEI
jgi:hypothetical protein